MFRTPPREGASSSLLLAFLLICPAARADTVVHEPVSVETSGRYGAGVSLLGDIDFDGYSDVLVGAPGIKTGTLAGAGNAYLYSGKSGALLRTHISPSPATQGAFGTAVLGLPDLNGDGRSEYAVGAPSESLGKGRIHVFSGATGSLLWSATGLPGTVGHGGCLALVPDCTGDGKADLVAGNALPDEEQTSVRIYDATTGLAWRTLTRPAAIMGAARFGHAVGGVPDVTGDGRGDVVVGASRTDVAGLVDRGSAWIYDGATGALVREIVTVDPETFGEFGTAVAGIGDLDGDGRGDIIVGAPREDVTGNDGWGRAHVYSGSSGGHLYSVNFPGTWTAARFGSAVAVATNFDDDGVPDFAISAPNAGNGGGGWVYQFSGADGAQIGYLISGFSGETGFGAAISTAGDCTQDGRSDLLVGAPASDAGPVVDAGKVELKRFVLNDGCGPEIDPVEVTAGSLYFSNVGATNFQDLESDCAGTPVEALNSDVHFEFHAEGPGVATFSTCATSFDTWIAVYRGCAYTQYGCVWGPPDACSDDASVCGNGGSSVSIGVAAGECLRLRVGGVGDEQGIASLLVTFAAGCEGDLNADGHVDSADLALLLSAWGTDDPPSDLNHDGVVDSADLAGILARWGACPN